MPDFYYRPYIAYRRYIWSDALTINLEIIVQIRRKAFNLIDPDPTT